MMMLYVHSILFISKLATAAHRTDPTKKTKSLRHKHRPGTQGHLLFRFLLVFYLPSLRDAYKNSQLCKSSFVSFPAGVLFQYVPLAVPSCPRCLSCPIGFSAGISGGSHFITSIVALGFLPLAVLVGLFIAFLQAVVGFVHCPFRVVFKSKAPPRMAGLYSD